jgi:tryptophanyl-tRNA synthetase
MADPGHVDKVLADGAMRAAAIAGPVIMEVKKIVGFVRSRAS